MDFDDSEVLVGGYSFQGISGNFRLRDSVGCFLSP